MTTLKFQLDNSEAANKVKELCDFKTWDFKIIGYPLSRDLYIDLNEVSKENHPNGVAADIREVVSLFGGGV